MAQNETWLNHDLLDAVKVQYLDGNLFSMDNAGNLIGVKLTRDGVDYSGGGSVSANVIRADGGTVAVVGALSGNTATVVLPQAAYAVPGVVSIVVKLTVSGEVTTIAAVVANVYQSSTDSVIDPGTIIPSVQTLIAAIDAAVASIPADYSSLWTSLAPAFSTSTNYTAGQYVTYNGAVYKFTTDHTAGAWNSSHVVATNIGNELSSLKSALNEKVNIPLDEYNRPTYGTNGQSLRTKGNGATEWADVGLPTDEQTAEAVSAWLDDNPEATTTVQDWSLTYKKLVKGTLGYVTPEMFGAKCDGETDDTTELQNTFDFAINNGLLIYVPSYATIIAEHIEISDKRNINIICDGVIKRKNNTNNTLISIIDCDHINIQNINLDGNVSNNSSGEYLLNEHLHCITFYNCTDVNIGFIQCKNPAGDAVYISNGHNINIINFCAIGDSDCGRNALSIIKGSHICVNHVYSYQIGVETMPGGIDLEPNSNSDDISDVSILSFDIITGGMAGFSISNAIGANIENISAKGMVKRTGNASGYTGLVTRSKYVNIDIEIHGNGKNVGVGILSCSHIQARMVVLNSRTGLLLTNDFPNSDLGKYIHLNGIIDGTTEEGIKCNGSFEDVTIDMTVTNTKRSCFTVNEGATASNIKLTGKFIKTSQNTSGNCINLVGAVQNIVAESLDMSTWPSHSRVRGTVSNADEFTGFNCPGYNYRDWYTSNDFYKQGTIILRNNLTESSNNKAWGWICVESGSPATFMVLGRAEIVP